MARQNSRVEQAVTIVGAGLAGLTIGQLLTERHIPVALFERESVVGGLARSFQYDQSIFDIGPHRFHSDNPDVIAYIKRILPTELEDIPRDSGVWFFNKYYDWPLGPLTILRLPKSILIRVMRDLVTLLSPSAHIESFEDHIINMFGKTLYLNFFKDYSTKFLKIPPQLTHADWAKTGLDRAIIDERLQMHTLWQLIFSLFRPKPDTRFLYPRYGVGAFCNRQAELITQAGGMIRTASAIKGIRTEAKTITHLITTDGEEVAVNRLVWTAPITLLAKLLGFDDPDLQFLHLVLYNIVIDCPVTVSYQWCYYGDFDLFFNRISNPETFSATNAAPGSHQLCVEVTAIEQSEVWRRPEQFSDRVVKDLCRVRLIPDPSHVKAIYLERVLDSYPIYDINYPQKLQRLLTHCQQFTNLTLAGRNGRFWYNNMDHSIANAFTVVQDLLGDGGVNPSD